MRKIPFIFLMLFGISNIADAGISTTTCAVASHAGCVDLNVSGKGSVGIQITGTWSGTITFQTSVGNTTFTSLTVVSAADTASTKVTTTTSNGTFYASIAGLSTVRVVFTSYSSGTANVSLATASAANYSTLGGGGSGGSGTVTSIATTSPITGGTITTTGTIACATCGVTGSPLSQFASTTSAQFAGVISDATGTGSVVLSISPALTSNPTVPTQASTDNSTRIASTAYVTTGIANAIAAVNPAVAVAAASAAVMPNTPTYANGVSGIGATLTSSTSSVLVVDGYTPILNDRILVKNQAAPANNGVYTVTQLGVGGLTPWIATRALDYDQPSDINNTGAIPVINGTANTATQWVVSSSVTTIGTDAITFTQFSLNPSTIPTKLAGTATIDFASVNDGACLQSNFTLTGALTGDYLAVKRPSSLNDGLELTMWVSAADTIRAQICNLSGGAIDAASATFGAMILR